jgi:Domain of unknown function (DUF4136)
MNRPREPRLSFKSTVVSAILVLLIAAIPLFARTVVDFDPSLDFSRYKTFAFVGPVDNMVMLEANPEIVDLRLRRAVNRELTKKGLHEVQPNQNPNLIVRYWANASQQVNIAVLGNWGPYGPYITSDWAWQYNAVTASSVKEGSLIIDLIDPHTKNLVWRVYLIRKITNADKDWNKADEDLAKAFESFPPSDKEKEERRKERAAHPPKS